MKLPFGLQIVRGNDAQKSLNAVGGSWRNMWRVIAEPFTGAWQKNAEEKRGDLLTYPTLYACVYRIASDIGKLPFSIRRESSGGVWKEDATTQYELILRKPNAFQSPAQFREYWIITKLLSGNAYILKRRDDNGIVSGLYVLDPERVIPMVSDAGNVFYQLLTDNLNTLPIGYPADSLIVPASEIIHDRCMTIHHPLIGVPPLAAAHWPALKNMKIVRSATEFFANNAQPGGLLTAPAGMKDDDAKKIQDYWNKEFSGAQSGKVAIIGADMKFTSFAMKSIDAQMVEQMRYSDEQICQPFGIPPFKVGIGIIPSGLGVDGVNLMYYNDALQPHIQHMEDLLDDGLGISKPFGVELDTDPLLRMDEAKRADVEVKLVSGMLKTPNEGRARLNLDETPGGETLWGQQQDYPLGMLADRMSWDSSMQQGAPPEQPMVELPKVSSEDVNAVRAFAATQKAIFAMNKRLRERNHVI